MVAEIERRLLKLEKEIEITYENIGEFDCSLMLIEQRYDKLEGMIDHLKKTEEFLDEVE